MLNRDRCAPGLIDMAEGAPMFVDCMFADLNPLVAAIGHVHVCPVRRRRSSAACRLARLSTFRAPRFQELAVLIKLGDARIALATGTRTSPAVFQVTVGRASGES